MKQSNEEWYERLGFELFARKDDGYNHLLENGEIFTLKSVFLKKSLVISLH